MHHERQMHKFQNAKWVAKDGSIFTEKEFKVRVDFTGKYMLQQGAIAFNVGQTLAEHIVQVHNDDIEQRACVQAVADHF